MSGVLCANSRHARYATSLALYFKRILNDQPTERSSIRKMSKTKSKVLTAICLSRRSCDCRLVTTPHEAERLGSHRVSFSESCIPNSAGHQGLAQILGKRAGVSLFDLLTQTSGLKRVHHAHRVCRHTGLHVKLVLRQEGWLPQRCLRTSGRSQKTPMSVRRACRR